ncbi:BMC domain-containing protein [Geobacillus thermodenitrificans]|jgi:ethanolamine utilization protein EutM|uniref:BMC domain-containing protein n=1 Tax=Geobacillus thermodenitrificans TaxID=33940 RepID=UPI002E1C3597|nr:BMC domain-containing protein [Geobacillus thermodenitrificans]
MKGSDHALGMIETIGLTSLIAAADEAVKAADIRIVTYQKPEAGIVTVYFIGDVASVKEAVLAGMQKAQEVGEYRASYVIPRPDENVIQHLIGNTITKKKRNKKMKTESIEDRRLLKEENINHDQGSDG